MSSSLPPSRPPYLHRLPLSLPWENGSETIQHTASKKQGGVDFGKGLEGRVQNEGPARVDIADGCGNDRFCYEERNSHKLGNAHLKG